MSTEAPEAHRTHRYRGAIAAAATLAVAGAGIGLGAAVKSFEHGQSEPTATSTDHPGKHKVHKPETTPTPGPKTIEQLPGYGQQVTPEQRRALQASTVQIVRLKSIGNGLFKEDFCNGIKAQINGGTSVVTAGHCMVNKGLDTIKEFPRLNTSPDPAHDPTLTIPQPVPESLSGKVSIWTIGADGLPDADHAIPVTRTVASKYPDLAFLKVDTSSPNADKFNAVPAINYKEAASSKPEPGAQVVIFNNNGIGSNLVETDGFYLGTTANPADKAQQLMWVSVDGKSADKDGCYYGRSGSAAMIAGAGITGPLATRIQPHDPVDLSGVPKREEEKYRQAVAAELGVSLENHDTTLCGFSVITPANVEGAAQLTTAP